MTAKCLATPAVALGLIALVVGCEGRTGKPPMGKVHGTVSYNGKPLDKGRVTFTPVSGDGESGGNNAMSPIESDGSYELTTFDTGDGAIIGQHIVTISVPSSNINDLNQPKADGSIAYVLPKEYIPKKYTTPKDSPLRNTVVEGDNKIDIELKK
ncbi:hypothetical protein P12x_000732 [Tundrisphaera lichenicola]|uniref:hypothetical protein n=1 Tax=Tundrisphaera lichenicola TaxID=2029860 RepID=UPI003EBBD5E5